MGSRRDPPNDVVVQVERHPSPGLWCGRRQGLGSTVEDRLIARMLAPWLDEELGAGVEGSISAAHAARVEQLTSDRSRRTLARTLARLLDRAQNPRPESRIPLRAPCPEQVHDAMPLILSIRARLLSGEPLAAQGIVRLKTVLGDRRGPCYLRSRPDALTTALRESWELLDGGKWLRAD